MFASCVAVRLSDIYVTAIPESAAASGGDLIFPSRMGTESGDMAEIVMASVGNNMTIKQIIMKDFKHTRSFLPIM
jgi:hypothetical protein